MSLYVQADARARMYVCVHSSSETGPTVEGRRLLRPATLQKWKNPGLFEHTASESMTVLVSASVSECVDGCMSA